MRLAIAAASLALASLAAHDAGASTFEVAPVMVALGQGDLNGMLTIKNQSSTPVRLKVDGRAWSETRGGEMKLDATTDMVVFPSLLSLGAGEARTVRVGTVAAASATERTYRLLVQELPPGRVQPGTLQVLTRMNIPVFVRGASEKAGRPVVSRPAIDQGELRFDLENAGDAHFKAQSVRAVVRGEGGRVVHELALKPWYVLAHGAREYRAALPAEVCKATRSARVEVTTDQGSASAEAELTCVVP